MDVFYDSTNLDNECMNLAKYGCPLYMLYLQSYSNNPQVINNFMIFLSESCLEEQIILKLVRRILQSTLYKCTPLGTRYKGAFKEGVHL
jgi:hypothetical protein